MKLRLHYERRTWPRKYRTIQDLCQNVSRELDIIGTRLQGIASSASAVDFEQVQNRINTSLRVNLVELHRILGYEVRYSQCLAAECLIRTVDNPGSLHRSMGILREHLRATHQHVDVVLGKLRNLEQNMVADSLCRFTEAAEDIQAIHVRILTEATALNMVIRLLHNNMFSARPNSRGPLASVPIVRRAMRESSSLQRAALQAYSQVSDRNVRRIVRTWLNILRVNEDLKNNTHHVIDEGDGRPTAGMKRARDEQTAMALALQYLNRHEQLEANRARGLETTAADDQIDVNLLDAVDDSGIADTHKHEFTEEEQGRLKRRRIR